MADNFAIYLKPISGSDFILTTEKGEPLGVATLDSSGHVPFSQLPFSRPVDYNGGYNAETNTPNLTVPGDPGDMYIVTTAGTKNLGCGSVSYTQGDILIFSGNNNCYEKVGTVSGAYINGTGFVMANGTAISYLTGTSSQFVKANGTLDSTAYLSSLTSSGNSISVSGNNVEVNTDKANTWTKAQRAAFVTGTDASTITLDLSTSNNFNIVLGGNRTLGVPTNIISGQSGVINIRQDSTGGRTLSYAWCYTFNAGAAPTLSTGKFQLDQLVYMVNSYATSTVTISNASPGVVTWNSHGLISGQRIQLTTTGSLPTGLSINTTYWVTVVDSNTFRLSSSFANLQAGTFINTSSAGSGTHTATAINISVAINANLS